MNEGLNSMTLSRFALPAALLLVLAGCSGFGFKSNDYKGAQNRAAQPLEVPPELTAPTMEDRYAIPDPRSQTTYSAYSQRNAAPAGGQAAGGNAVLPKIEVARLDRAGDQRWLVVKGEPDRVWPALREFWVEAGYPLVREEPAIGIMETEWSEDRAKIDQDIVRRTIGRVMPGLWSTPRRDKFRTRLEKGSEPGTTEVFVSNRAMEEVYTNSQQDRTVWQPLAADRELEAEMLSRMMVKMGADASKVAEAKAVASARPVPGTRASATPAAPDARNAVLENAGAGPLVVNDSFDRAWRRVGLALDRVGFTVEDRDRSKGLFFVRYIDPEADVKTGDQPGLLERMKFWKPTPKSAQPQYRIHVSDAGASMSQVLVQDAKGEAERSATSRKILSLLFDQLK
jgi:outer membrane protein assembly factor BamC